MRYRPGLDGIRALAVLAVVGFHVRPDLLPGGSIGVDVFFVLSGWLITSLLVSEHGRTGTIRLGAFYLRRVLRLMPALVLAVAFAAIVASTVTTDNHLGGDVAAALTYTFDFRILGLHGDSILSHTWSLAVEEQFYLIWPPLLVLRFHYSKRPSTLAIGAFVVAAIASVTTAATDGLHLLGFTPLGHACELLAGAAIATVAPKVPLWIAALGGAVPIGYALLASQAPRWAYLGGYAGMAIGVALLVQHVATNETVLSRGLGVEPLAWLGRRSYGVYLYHFPMLYLVNAELGHGIRQPAIVLGSIAVAAASYQFVELPFLRLKHRFEPRQASVIEATKHRA